MPEAWGAVTDCSPSFYKVPLPSLPCAPDPLEAASCIGRALVSGVGPSVLGPVVPFSHYVTFG